MKNMLEYYYNMNNYKINKNNNKYYIKKDDNTYILEKVYNKDKLLKNYNLINNNFKYNNIIRNKDNKMITEYRNENYILRSQISSQNINMNQEINRLNYRNIKKKTWKNLWIIKVENIEKLYNHIIGKYNYVDESIDYFIGMMENAILYLDNNKEEVKKTGISHTRITKDNFYNPQNIIEDCIERDIGEYLKYLFFTNQEINVESFLYNYNLTYQECINIYSRLLLPNYYFDLIDDVNSIENNKEKIKETISKINDYELYLYNIYIILNKIHNIPEIKWLKKD